MDVRRGQEFIETRRKLTKSSTGLTSQQLAISVDLITTGIVAELWGSQDEAVNRLKVYWKWFKSETEQSAGLGQLLKDFLATEVKSCKASGKRPEVYSAQLRAQISAWVDMGWLYESPKMECVLDCL